MMQVGTGMLCGCVFRRHLILGALATAVCLVWGCGLVREESREHRPRFVMVVVDESESFAKDWDDMLRSASVVANRLGPGEGMGVVGIDDQGFQPEDLRIPIRVLDPAPLQARIGAVQLARDVRALSRRTSKKPHTDVLGAVRHAAYFLNRHQDLAPVLVIFSDMRQTPRMPTQADAVDLSFPPGTRANCFFVDATDSKDWRHTVGTWQAILAGAGVSVEADDFHQKGETKVEIGRLFPPMM